MAVQYFVFWIINSVTIVVANVIFPTLIVLGTANISFWWAVLHSMGKLALIRILAVPAIEYFQEKQGRAANRSSWKFELLAVNFVGLWVVSRFPEQFGLGLSSWWVALMLAVILNATQGWVMKMIYKR